MTPTIRYHNASWPPTKTFDQSNAATTSSAPGKIISFEKHRYPSISAPAGYTAIEDVVAKSESNPRKKAALARARAKLAGKLQGDEGDTIRTVRLRLGWSQAKLADLLGSSQSHVARIERGSENVAWETMKKLCKALQVDMNTMDEMLTRQRHIFEGSN
ncbi:Helix-turn-helix domain-containing protein [Onishia taeanensis]|uniref:Helix-turn-helix domain-containing protein n=1 Tax=Onishia taeanensis TaxID=284577 RepID=A0A1G7NDC0_9GAMM|nr:helix-turn-helix transcriptional regulator [Halomonas taeanensis]SDF72095.1 Helix-turn-helix domain-containing protein [Halomonas taeanensis]